MAREDLLNEEEIRKQQWWRGKFDLLRRHRIHVILILAVVCLFIYITYKEDINVYLQNISSARNSSEVAVALYQVDASRTAMLKWYLAAAAVSFIILLSGPGIGIGDYYHWKEAVDYVVNDLTRFKAYYSRRYLKTGFPEGKFEFNGVIKPILDKWDPKNWMFWAIGVFVKNPDSAESHYLVLMDPKRTGPGILAVIPRDTAYRGDEPIVIYEPQSVDFAIKKARLGEYGGLPGHAEELT